MKIRVPFYKQSNSVNCAQFALKMVFSYFGRNIDLNTLNEKMEAQEGKGISTIQIAKASASLGFKTELYSKHISFNPENLELEFYKKYASNELEKQSNKWMKEAKAAGVKFHQKSLPLNKILQFVKKDKLPIILLDWNIVIGKSNKGYQGHFVPIVGYDVNNVYVHNQGFHGAKKFRYINKRLFDKARKSPGTDEDFLVIYKPIL